MTTAFVLSAGGVLGDFEIGALRFLYNRGIRPEIVCGSSVGAINGAAIAQGEGGLESLEAIWLELNSNSDLYLEQPWFTTLSEKLRGLVATNLTAEAAKMFLAPPLFMLDVLSAGVSAVELADAIGKALRAGSIYDPAPLAAKIRRNLDTGAVARSGVRLRIGVCDLETGRLRFVNELGRFVDSPDEVVNLTDAVLASAAIPVLFPPVKLGAHNYVDGGVRTLLPIGAAAGATEVFAIVAPSPDIGTLSSFDSANLVRVGQRCLGIQYDQTLHNDMFPPGGWGLPVHHIFPSFDVHPGLDIEPGHISITSGYGFMRAADRVVSAGNTDNFNQFVQRSDDITRRRMAIWNQEHLANGKLRPEEHLDSGVIRVPDPDALRAVRAAKRDLRDRIANRKRLMGSLAPQLSVTPQNVNFGQTPLCSSQRKVALVQNLGGGAVPPDADRWFLEWERHTWMPMMPTPWDAFYSPAGNVPAEAPPALTGNADLTITSISTTHPAFQARPSGAAVNMTLREGAVMQIEVTFTPASEGQVQGLLEIASTNGTAQVRLEGTGIRRPPTIVVNPQSLNFGRVLQDREYTADFTLRNLGSDPLIISQPPISSDPVFSIEEYTQRIECFGSGLIRVKCQVSDEARHSATITFPTTDPLSLQKSLPVEAAGSPAECGGLAEQLQALEADLEGAQGQERARILQQINNVRNEMNRLHCPPAPAPQLDFPG